MQAASRPYALAAAVLAATSAVVAIPLASRPFQLPIRSLDTRLVNADIGNIPVNLFDDIINIPFNEVQGLDTVANSLLFTGTWWVPSTSNLWGIDPGDPTHVALIDALLAPFPSLTEGLGGLNYQIDGLLAAELPVSGSCDAATCFPIVPPEVITGSTQFDRDIGFLEALSGQQSFGLFDNWYRVPLSDLFNGYNFNPANDPGAINPSGVVHSGFGFGGPGDTNPFEGGTGPGDAMPWDGTTYTLNLFQPFTNFYNSLLQTPATDGIGGTGIEIPTLTDIAQAFQNLAAGTIIDFDPFVPGSPACPAACALPASETVVGLVQQINHLSPGGTPAINEWLAQVAAGTANGPTQDQINSSIALLQTGIYNLTPTELANVDKVLASVNPELPYAETNAGWYTDPAYLAYTGTGPLDPVYGGYNPTLLAGDLGTLFTNNQTNWSELTNLNVWWFLADPATGTPPAAATDAGTSAAPELPNLFSSLDPTFSTDLSNLVAGMGLTAGSDLLGQLASELSAQLAADLGTVLPSSILSMF